MIINKRIRDNELSPLLYIYQPMCLVFRNMKDNFTITNVCYILLLSNMSATYCYYGNLNQWCA